MKIRMKTRAAGPGQNRAYQPGQVVEVDDKTAVAWLNGGYAEAVKREAEAAVVAPGERAVLPGLGAEPVFAIRGIGKATARKLATVGVENVAGVAALEGRPLLDAARAAGVSEETAAGWVEEARMLCEEDSHGE